MVNASATLPRKIQAGLAQLRHQMQAELDHQRRRHLRQTMKDLVMPKVVDPVQRRLATEHFGRMQNEVARHSSEDQRNHQQ